MEQLRQEIADLEQQEINFQNDQNNATDSEQAQTFINELNIVRNKLSEKRHELQQLEEKEQQRVEMIDEKVHAEAIPFAVAGVDLDGIPIELIQLIEEVVKVDRKRILTDHAIELEQLETERDINANHYQHTIREQAAIIENGTAENRLLIHDNGNLRDQLDKVNAEVEDLESKLANASALIAEKDEEIAKLNQRITEYEQAEEYRQRQEKPLSVTTEESTSLQAKADAVKKLFTKVVDWGSSVQAFKPDGSFELVKRKELETDWESADNIPETAATEESGFPLPAPELSDTLTTGGLAGDKTVSQGDEDTSSEPKSIEQILTEHRERLEALEQAVFTQQSKAVA